MASQDERCTDPECSHPLWSHDGEYGCAMCKCQLNPCTERQREDCCPCCCTCSEKEPRGWQAYPVPNDGDEQQMAREALSRNYGSAQGVYRLESDG
jgi:hypothetical protein